MEQKKHRKAKKVLLILAGVVLVLAVGVFVLLKLTFLKSFPKLKGEPEIGKWYEVAVEGSQSSDGSEWHGIFKKGTENKVIVYFFGGGVSITPETSEGGNQFYATNMTGQDFVAQGGIGSKAEDAETHNTQHTIISSNVFDKLEDGVSVADWIYAAVNGDVQSHGLALLEK